MDAAFTAEQDEIRRTLRELVAKRCGPDQVEAAVRTPAGHDSALWQTLAERLSLPGLAVPDAYGGAGRTTTELALACEELGRVLVPSPLLATAVLAAPLIARLGTEEQCRSHLPGLAAGRTTATLAVPGASLATALGLTGDITGDWAGGGRAGGVQAGRDGDSDGWRLYGQAEQVLDGHSADLLVVAAHTGGFARSRTLLYLVRATAPGVAAVRQPALDATRPQARLELRDSEAELLGADDARAVAEALTATGDAAAAALAAEAAGAADAALSGTVEHIGRREQFANSPGTFQARGQFGSPPGTFRARGQFGNPPGTFRAREQFGNPPGTFQARGQFGHPSGAFQAVKQRLADVYVAVRAARSAAYYAAWATTADGTAAGAAAGTAAGAAAGTADGAERAGALALAQALEALRAASSEAVQLHDGLGSGRDHDARPYFKRAAGDELLFGPVHRLRAQAAERAGLFAAPSEAAV